MRGKKKTARCLTFSSMYVGEPFHFPKEDGDGSRYYKIKPEEVSGEIVNAKTKSGSRKVFVKDDKNVQVFF